MEHRKNRFRFSDWNIVTTGVGACWEPSCLQLQGLGRGGFPSSTPDDDINRVDKIDLDWDWRNPYLRDVASNTPLIGGFCILGRDVGYVDSTKTPDD